MLRSERQQGSYCKEKCQKLLLSIKNALSCLFQSSPHKKAFSPQTYYQDYRFNLKKEYHQQYKQNMPHQEQFKQNNSKTDRYLVDYQNKIRSMLKYYSVFLLCEIALIVICYYIDNAYFRGNASIQDERNNSILFRILMNITMIILSLIFYNKLKINIQNIQNIKQPFLAKNKFFRQLLIFITFSTFSIGQIFVNPNHEVVFFEALICIVIHNFLQQNSKILSTSLEVLISTAIIIKIALREESISTMITIGFLQFSLIVIILRVEKNSESCQCRSLSRNKQENQNQVDEVEDEFEQKFRESEYFSLNFFISVNKGICCKKCGKPFKCITDNIQLLEEEIIQILEENKNIGIMMNNIPHGYCIIDNKQQKVLLANSPMINRTGSIDIDVLYQYLIDLRVKIGNTSSFTEFDQNIPKKQYSSSNNSVYPTKQNQQLGFRNNNFHKLNCNLSDKTNIINHQKKLYNQNYQINNLNFQNNNGNSNNFYNNNTFFNNFNSFQNSIQPQVNQEQKENEDIISNQYNQLQNSQKIDIQQQEQNIQQKRATKESRKNKNINQRQTQNNVYQRNIYQSSQIQNNTPISQIYDKIKKFSHSQDDQLIYQHNINPQNQFQYQSGITNSVPNNNINNQINKFPLISGIAERLVHSSENCSINYTNFDSSPMNQAKQINNINGDKEYLNNGYNNQRLMNTNELNQTRTIRNQPDQNLYTIMKTDDGFLANTYNQRNGQNFEELNDQKKSMNLNLQNITEIDSSNIQLFDNKTNQSIRNQSQKVYPQTSMKILQNTDPNEFAQRLSYLSQQLIKHKSQTDTKKKDTDFPKELITLQNDSFYSKPNNIQNTQQNTQQNITKNNENTNNKYFQKRTNTISINNIKMSEFNRKRVLTENIVTTAKEYENNFQNQLNEKKDINSINSYNNYQLNTPNNKYSSANAVNPVSFPINDNDNMHIISIDDIINYPIMEMNNKYSFKLSESFGEFTSVNIIKADDHLFYFIFDGNNFWKYFVFIKIDRFI